MKNQPNLNAAKIVFLDESSINLGMTRLYGRASKSERVNDYVPDVRFQRISILSTVRLDGKQVPFIFRGTLNGELFKKYIEDMLAPTLSEGDIVIMDNSSVHKVNGVCAPIVLRGAKVLYLPPYSPDFNPIELLWSKMKAFSRKRKACTHENLVEALNSALDYITLDDIAAWFKHDGYSINNC